MEARFLGVAELTRTPSVAVVVDVMRAFTVAAWAFGRGAEKIVLAGSLTDALALKARHPDWVALKDGPPAPGFDAVNSPFLRRAAGSRAATELTEGVRQGAHPDDVGLRLELDRFPFAMVASSEDSLMVLRPYAVPSPSPSPSGGTSA